MVRQYKAMQEQLGKRVADLEAQNKSLREAARLKDEQIAKLQVRLGALVRCLGEVPW